MIYDGDVVEVTVIHDNTESGEQLSRYQFGVGAPFPIDDADLLTDLGDLLFALYNAIKAFISIKNEFRELKVFNVTQDRLVGSGPMSAYTGGNGADPSAPQGVALYCWFPTSVPRVILSKYLPSPPTSIIAGTGRPTVATVTALSAFAANLMTPYTGTHGVYTYGYLSPKALTFVQPDVANVSGVFAYQRRRKPGRGA